MKTENKTKKNYEITAVLLVLFTAVILIGSSGRLINNYAGRWSDTNTVKGVKL